MPEDFYNSGFPFWRISLAHGVPYWHVAHFVGLLQTPMGMASAPAEAARLGNLLRDAIISAQIDEIERRARVAAQEILSQARALPQAVA